ncbi:unnamed protein product, partial [Cyprideis torosa]
MLPISKLREEKERVIQGLKKRGWSDHDIELVDITIAIDDRRKGIQTELDGLLAQRNSLSKEIGELFKSGQREEADKKKKEVEALKEQIAELEYSMREDLDMLSEKMLEIPNIPHDSVPQGLKESDNAIEKDWTGELPELDKNAIPHWELGSI